MLCLPTPLLCARMPGMIRRAMKRVKKYLLKEEDKMELLRKLDRDVTEPGTMWAIVVGIVGCLLRGIGMCCTMV